MVERVRGGHSPSPSGRTRLDRAKRVRGVRGEPFARPPAPGRLNQLPAVRPAELLGAVADAVRTACAAASAAPAAPAPGLRATAGPARLCRLHSGPLYPVHAG